MLHPIYRFEDPPDLVVAIIPKCLIAGWRATRDLLSGFEVALEERGHEVEAAHVETLNSRRPAVAARNREDVALRVEQCVWS